MQKITIEVDYLLELRKYPTTKKKSWFVFFNKHQKGGLKIIICQNLLCHILYMLHFIPVFVLSDYSDSLLF